MTPLEQPITNIIREAIINNHERENQFNEIREGLLIDRNKAKQLFYAFLYYADEEYLDEILGN